MSLVSAAIMALGLSVDSLGVGVVYGLKGIRVPAGSRLIIAAVSALVFGASMLVGGVVTALISIRAARLIGAGVLVAAGITVIMKSWTEDSRAEERTLLRLRVRPLGLIIQILREPSAADQDRSGHISPHEALALGLALAVDSIGVGFGASLAGMRSPLVPLAVGLACYLMLRLGAWIGKRYSWKFNGRLSFVPGVFLVLLGVSRMF